MKVPTKVLGISFSELGSFGYTNNEAYPVELARGNIGSRVDPCIVATVA